MSVLVDSSVWINYFRDPTYSDELGLLIQSNLVVTNRIILAELVPALHVRNQRHLIVLLREIQQQPLKIDWDAIESMQVVCLKRGIHGVGIPDLLIAQNAMQGELQILTEDKHFALMARHLPLRLR